MSTIDAFYSNAMVGLTSSQQALSIVSNNISNSATPGYTREVATDVPIGGASGNFNVVAERQVSTFLNAGVQTAQSTSSANAAYLQQATQLSSVLASSTTDIGTSLQTFFTSLQTMAADPAAVPPRQTVINNAQTLVNSLQGVGAQISQLGSSVNAQIQGDVTQINTLSAQIALQNRAIATAEAGNTGQPPNDLLDQRDQSLQSLSKLVSVSTVQQGDGSLSVFVGNGQSLVVGGNAQSLQAIPSTTDNSQLQVGYQAAAGGTGVALPDSSLTGGDLGAMLQFRNETLNPAAMNLSHLATVFAQTVNNQQSLGVDLNGRTGSNLFTLPQPTIVGSNSLNPSAAPTAVPSLTISDPSKIQASNYTLSFSAASGNYTLSQLNDPSSGAVLTPPTVLYNGTSLPTTQIPGYSFNLTSGAMNDGDTFTIRPYQDTLNSITMATSDPAAIAAASQFTVQPGASNSAGTSLVVTGMNGTPSSTLFPATVKPTATAGQFIITPANNANPPQTVSLSNGTLTYVDPSSTTSPPAAVVFTVGGTPATTDSFTISTNEGPVAGNTAGNGLANSGNNENLTALSGFQTASLVDTGGAMKSSLSAEYSRVVGVVGSATAVYKARSSAADSVLSNLVAQQQTVSGVNLDEEAANLLKFQQQYQASAKVMQVASTLFNSLLQI